MKFSGAYAKVLHEAIWLDLSDNYDAERFGPEIKQKISLKEKAKKVFRRAGVTIGGRTRNTIFRGQQFVHPHLNNLEWLYSKLEDHQSKELLVKLAAFRALGHRKIRLPTNTSEFWEGREKGYNILGEGLEIDAQFLGWKLRKRDLTSLGYPIQMFTLPGACYTTFIHQQYRCETANGAIECKPGDYAIDAGGCYGDTALYFAHQVGSSGKVVSFEFLPVNVSIFRKNLELNPSLASRISLIEKPVFSKSGQRLFVLGNGPGTRVVAETADPEAQKVETLAIDDLVGTPEFERVDFIKMDIEGAELQALKGSEKVLRKYKPQLAITVYHDFKDFWEIPRYLEGLNLGYRFYLRHFTIHAEETVLFAKSLT